MANEQNLTHKLTESDARKGGINSGKTRREKANLRKCLEALLEGNVTDTNGTVRTGAEAITLKLFAEAGKGDVRAFEVIRDTIGQKPVDKVMVAEVEQSVIDEVEQMVNDNDKDNGS